MRFTFVFCYRRVKAIQAIKNHLDILMLLLLLMQVIFSTVMQCNPSSFGSIKRITCFSRFDFCFEISRIYISIQIIESNCCYSSRAILYFFMILWDCYIVFKIFIIFFVNGKLLSLFCVLSNPKKYMCHLPCIKFI